MPDETKPQTPEEIAAAKAAFVKAFYDAPDRKTKGDVVRANPQFKEVFSAANYD